MRRKFEHFKELYQQDLNAAADDLDAAVSGISFTTDLALSVKDADLTIEAITENLVIKKISSPTWILWHHQKLFSAPTLPHFCQVNLRLKHTGQNNFRHCIFPLICCRIIWQKSWDIQIQNLIFNQIVLFANRLGYYPFQSIKNSPSAIAC